MYFKVSILAIVLLFSGCSNSVIQSTVDLNNEFEVKWGLTGSPNQLKQMSVNGLSPISNVGEFYYIKPSNGLQSAIMLNGSDFVSSPSDFYIQRTTYKSDVKEETLFEIKNLINKLERLSTKILDEKIKSLKIEAKNTEIKRKIDSVNKEIVKVSTDKAQSLVTQKEELFKELNNNQDSSSNLDVEKIKKELKILLDSELAILLKIKEIEEKLKDENLSTEDKSKFEKEKEEKEKELITLNYKTHNLVKTYGVIAYELQYDLLYDKYLEITSKKNIFVFRWNLKNDNNANINATDYLTIDSKSKIDKTGYLIASGVVVEKLVPNRRFIDYLESKANISNLGAYFRGHLGMVTYTLKVKNLVSFVSQKKETMFKLLASLKDVQHFSSDIKNITNVELGISLLSVSDVATFSNFSKPYHEKIRGTSLYKYKTTSQYDAQLAEGVILAAGGTVKPISRIESVNLINNDISVMNSNTENTHKPNQTTIFSVITEATELADMYK
ncbi:hypothetical protein [Arcobacter sp. LA11]|uniref:hypothetical protein n=1 Tax=Arcobacter sp. LA11 TaxID=1898176 RepID=UPI000934F1D7|nr:hypothetical protein [Arcobacter sp. LA11]